MSKVILEKELGPIRRRLEAIEEALAEWNKHVHVAT
jgi:hypothetical protein